MTAVLISTMTISAILAAVFIFIRVKYAGVAGLVSKAIASFAFLISGVVLTCCAGTPTAFKLLFWVGLSLGVAGDILLDCMQISPKKGKFLNGGIFAFGIGHIFYLAGILLYAMQFVSVTLSAVVAIIALPVSALAIFFVVRVLKMNMKGYVLQSFGYTLILTYNALLMFALALSGGVPYMPIFATGAFLFLTSDFILSFQYFGGQEKNKVLTVLNHVFYYAAQLIYAALLGLTL